VLLSGGLDSATVAAWAVAQGYACLGLSVDYGQRCRRELEAARRLAEHLGFADYRAVGIDLAGFGGSALLGDGPVPTAGEARHQHGVPETYVPARNTVLLALALGWAEVAGAYTVFIGANSLDYSGYPDCRPEYVDAFNHLAGLALAEGAQGGRKVSIEAPLMLKSKAEIVRLGLSLGLDYSLTVSCYDPDPDGRACGRCESCVLRLKGFAAAGFQDPAAYRE